MVTKTVVIIGAGPAGLALACSLGLRMPNVTINILEAKSELTKQVRNGGYCLSKRSILTRNENEWKAGAGVLLGNNGARSLKRILYNGREPTEADSTLEQFLSSFDAQPLKAINALTHMGRLCSRTSLQSYLQTEASKSAAKLHGNYGDDVAPFTDTEFWSTSRPATVWALQARVEAYPNVKLLLSCRTTHIDSKLGRVTYKEPDSEEEAVIFADLIFGCDGNRSICRSVVDSETNRQTKSSGQAMDILSFEFSKLDEFVQQDQPGAKDLEPLLQNQVTLWTGPGCHFVL